MNKPVFPKPKCATAAEPKAEAQPPRKRPRAKWVDLRDALALLTEAQELAAENAKPAGEIGPVDEAGT